MIKKIVIIVFSIHCFTVLAQVTYPSLNINLLSNIDPESVSVPYFSAPPVKYSGCWGWYQSSKNKEYAIVGTTTGAYFIDVTIPTIPVIIDSVKVYNNAIHREIKTYQHYAYIITDEFVGSRTCVVDLQYLPDSVHEISTLIHQLPRTAHTLFIDNDKLYLEPTNIPSVSNPTVTVPTGLAVYSLANPETPLLLRHIEQDYPTVSGGGCSAHDVFVSNDTIFASCQNDGLKVYKFTAANTFSLLASYSNYIYSGYNHSSCLTQDKKHLVFCDEVPEGLPAKMIDIRNLNNIQFKDTFMSHPGATPHNPYIVGNKWCWLSSYEDGIYLYDISNPNNVSMYGYFDTYPLHGFNDNYPAKIAGNWGAYPYLPSKIILALDMQNGLFILEGDNYYKSTAVLSIKNSSNSGQINIKVYPNPFTEELITETFSNDYLNFVLVNALGQKIITYTNQTSKTVINTNSLASGLYILNIFDKENTIIKTYKFVK